MSALVSFKPSGLKGAFSFKAASDIAGVQKDEDVAEKLYGIPIAQSQKIVQRLGFNKDIIQEEIAREAYNPASYPAYLEKKETALNAVRLEVVKQWGIVYNQLIVLGWTKAEAKAKADYAASVYKAIQMDMFYSMYPNSGAKAERKL